MNKLITLLRLRQEGFQTEAFEDDFIIDIPEELIDDKYFNDNKVLEYCEKKFREAAQATIVGPNCEKIIADTSNDYNWGDFTLYTSKEVLQAVGISRIEDYDGPVSKDIVYPRYIVEVNQDEVLLPDCVGCTLIIREFGKQEIRIEATTDLYTGAIIVDATDEDIAAERIDYGNDVFVDFGNGIEHPVAINEVQRDETENIFFCFEELG